MSSDSLGLLMSWIRSRMPSMMTSPMFCSSCSAQRMMSLRWSGVYSRSTKNSIRSFSRSVGSPASLSIRCSTLWQWHLLCSVSMYSTRFLQGGSSALYFSTSFPDRAEATMALTLNVFLLLGFPVDALKLPNVATVTPSTCTISCGKSYFSVTFRRMYCSSDLHFSSSIRWLSGSVISVFFMILIS